MVSASAAVDMVARTDRWSSRREPVGRVTRVDGVAAAGRGVVGARGGSAWSRHLRCDRGVGGDVARRVVPPAGACAAAVSSSERRGRRRLRPGPPHDAKRPPPDPARVRQHRRPERVRQSVHRVQRPLVQARLERPLAALRRSSTRVRVGRAEARRACWRVLRSSRSSRRSRARGSTTSRSIPSSSRSTTFGLGASLRRHAGQSRAYPLSPRTSASLRDRDLAPTKRLRSRRRCATSTRWPSSINERGRRVACPARSLSRPISTTFTRA